MAGRRRSRRESERPDRTGAAARAGRTAGNGGHLARNRSAAHGGAGRVSRRTRRRRAACRPVGGGPRLSSQRMDLSSQRRRAAPDDRVARGLRTAGHDSGSPMPRPPTNPHSRDRPARSRRADNASGRAGDLAAALRTRFRFASTLLGAEAGLRRRTRAAPIHTRGDDALPLEPPRSPGSARDLEADRPRRAALGDGGGGAQTLARADPLLATATSGNRSTNRPVLCRHPLRGGETRRRDGQPCFPLHPGKDRTRQAPRQPPGRLGLRRYSSHVESTHEAPVGCCQAHRRRARIPPLPRRSPAEVAIFTSPEGRSRGRRGGTT